MDSRLRKLQKKTLENNSRVRFFNLWLANYFFFLEALRVVFFLAAFFVAFFLAILSS